MPRFKTLEVSNPAYESNNLRFITVNTPNLKGRGDIVVYVPPETLKTDTLPVVILLHGVYGSAWSWAHSGGVHLKVNELITSGELPTMILAMPSDGLWSDGSAYLAHDGYDFEKWIVDDVPDALCECVWGAAKESPMFISGLSMGGFGALRIGAKYGAKFRAISGHSSITSLSQMKYFTDEPLIHYAQDDFTSGDIFETFLKYRISLPPIRFDCGANDILINYNRALHKKMEQENIPHIYQENPGTHEWPYWTTHITDSLKFFADKL